MIFGILYAMFVAFSLGFCAGAAYSAPTVDELPKCPATIPDWMIAGIPSDD